MKFSTVIRAASLFTTLSACVFAQTVFTEDFESGKIDPNVWEQRVTGTATVAVEATDGAHGQYALHVHYPDMAARSYAFVVATHLPDSVRTHYFGRAYMKITPGLGMTHNPLIFTGEPGWPISKFQEIGAYRGDWMPSYQENKSPAGQGRGEVTYRSDTEPPLDKWFLLEWEFNDNPTTISMWINGERLMDTMNNEKVDMLKFVWPKGSDTASNLVGGYREFGFGARVWGAPPKGIDIYYDDIAIGTTRIGAVK
jgi:hypothetical protein